MVGHRCPVCNEAMPADRIDAIKDFNLPFCCIACSRVEAPIVLMNFEHKTGGTPMVIPNNEDGSHNEELIRKATRCFKRSR